MKIDPGQEYPLDAAARPSTPLWSENFALVFADPVQRVSALYSIGTWYRDTSVWRENLAVTMPDGQILVARNFGRQTGGAVVSASLSRYEIIEPEQSVRLAFDGPVSTQSFADLMRSGANGGQTRQLKLDLRFQARAPIWDMHAGHNTDATGVAGAMHIEQLGVCDGSLEVDGQKRAIAGAQSCRDHSRGARDITQYRNHCWINGSFPGDRHFQLYIFRMHHIDGIALSLANVFQGREPHAATIEQVEYVEGVADTGKLQTIVLRSALGDMKIAVREVYATIPITMTAPFNPAVGILNGPHGQIFDEAIRIEWEGKVGYGWSERGFSKQPIR